MTDLSQSILQSFFQDSNSGDFLKQYWPEKAAHSHGNFQRLHSVFQSELLTNFEALAKLYRGPAFYFAGEAGVMHPVDRPPLQLYRSGRTIYFGNIEPFVKGSTNFLRQLEQELGVNPGCARMGIFASPKNDGATVHYDTNEVFSIQILGSKKFHIAPLKELSYPSGQQYSKTTPPQKNHYPQMQNGFPDPANAEFECVDMERGSVLFMPRGTWHHTSANSAESVAISIIVDPPLAVDMILNQLKLTLMQKTQWRKPLLGCWNQAALSEETELEIKQLLEDLKAVAANLNEKSIIQNAGSQNLWLEGIDRNTRFQRNPTCSMQFQNMGDHIQVTIKTLDSSRTEKQTGSVKVSEDIKQVLQWILHRNQPFSASQLGIKFNANADELLGLIQGLADSNVLQPLWYDAINNDAD